jgi:hypothetical protein
MVDACTSMAIYSYLVLSHSGAVRRRRLWRRCLLAASQLPAGGALGAALTSWIVCGAVLSLVFWSLQLGSKLPSVPGNAECDGQRYARKQVSGVHQNWLAASHRLFIAQKW